MERRQRPEVQRYIREYARVYRKTAKGRELRRNHARQYQKTKEYRDWCNQYRRERRQNDPNYKLTYYLRNREVASLKSFKELIACSIDFLWQHLEKNFKEGMTRENYGSVWHVDHIKALATAASEEELIRLFHWKNLQPLFGADNCRKGKKSMEECPWLK
jgi:5-methylcytosine-specific restriction endonuclease McrA